MSTATFGMLTGCRRSYRAFSQTASFTWPRRAIQPFRSSSRERRIDINVGGTINLFECVRTLVENADGGCRVFERGIWPGRGGRICRCGRTIRCGLCIRMGSARSAQDLLAAQYFANYKIPCVRIRIFNTTGPGKLGDVCSDLTRRAVEIELGLRPPSLMVGNLTRRAIIDVRDLVRGLWLSAECCAAGDVYNLGATQIYSIQEVIETIQTEVKRPFTVQEDPLLVRGCDEPVIAGDITKFQQCSGWTPEISLNQTLQDMLDWWRKELTFPSYR